MQRINIAEKFAGFSEQWQPKVVAELNGQEVKLVKVQGTFPWHHHDDVDDLFFGLERPLSPRVPGQDCRIGAGRVCGRAPGVEHRTAADEEGEVILFEPAGVLNTGNVIDRKFTAPVGARI